MGRFFSTIIALACGFMLYRSASSLCALQSSIANLAQGSAATSPLHPASAENVSFAAETPAAGGACRSVNDCLKLP